MELTNYRGTVNVLGAAKAAGVRRLVQVIGIGAHSRSPFPLPRTQGLAAEAVLAAGVPATVLEAAVIHGRSDAFVTTLTGLARVAPLMVVPGSGRARLEPISCLDVAEAAVNALDLPETAGQRYQIAGPDLMTLDQAIDSILQTLEVRRLKLHMPTAVLRPVVRLMGALLPEPPVTPGLLDLLELDIRARDDATAMLLGHEPSRFAESLDYAREVTAGRFISTTLGRQNRRGAWLVTGDE
jgi:NADH dehydrogenase